MGTSVSPCLLFKLFDRFRLIVVFQLVDRHFLDRKQLPRVAVEPQEAGGMTLVPSTCACFEV